MGKLSRTKGHSFEREIANKLKCIFPDAKRKLEYQIQDCIGIDLSETGNLSIQCKRGKKYCSISKIEEVEALHGKFPALITKGDRKKEVICMYFDDFLKIAQDIGEIYK